MSVYKKYTITLETGSALFGAARIMSRQKNQFFHWLKIIVFLAVVPVLFLLFDQYGENFINSSLHRNTEVNALRVGTPAPNFSVPAARMASNKKFELHELKGFPVVLHFWATWCGPCLQELPEILKLADTLRPQGFSFVAVAIDRDWATLETFFARHPELASIRDRMILVLDPDSEVANAFGSSRFPETFLINRDLVIDNKFIGAQPWSDARMLPYLESLRAAAK